MSAATNPSREPTVTLGLVGVGLVGRALCERWVAAGYRVMAHDIDPRAFERLDALGITTARTGTEAAGVCAVDLLETVQEETDRIVLSLPGPTEVREIILGERGLLKHASRPLDLLDTTTGDPTVVEEVAREVTRQGGNYTDACIVGSSRQVRQADAMVVAGTTGANLESWQDVLRCFTREVHVLGPAGSGTRTKLVMNLVIGLHRAVLGEALELAVTLGLDPRRVLEALRSSVAHSRVMDTKGEKMLKRDFEPDARLAQHLKDVRLMQQLATSVAARTPLTDLHETLLEEAVRMGLGELDNAAVVEVFRKR